MLLYHGSNVPGLERLVPKQADHDRPYVYLSTIETVAAFYLCNAVDRPYYWFPYGFDGDGVTPVYHELYPDALRSVSDGVKGCIYIVDAKEDQIVPFKSIPCARLGTVPLDVVSRIDIPNAYERMQEYIRGGKMKLGRFEDKTPEQLDRWYDMVADYLDEKDMINIPDCSYARFVQNRLPRAWERYLENLSERSHEK